MQTVPPTGPAHGHPFVFIDRVLEVQPGIRAVAIKNVTYGEAILQGYYPGRPLMPNSLVLEALLQVAGVAMQGERPIAENAMPRLATTIRNLVFHRVASPGDQLRLTAELVEPDRGRAQLRVKATVGDDAVAEGEIVFG